MKKIGNFWFPDRENYEFYINQIVEKDVFQKERLDGALQFVKNWEVAVDVGANIGSWSLAMSKKFKKVYAFELLSENYECLVENTKGFSNIICYNYGLGKEQKKVDIIYDKNIPNTLAGVCADLNKEGPYEIRTLDSFNLEGCDFLKIDVEGLESHVLMGGVETIKKYKPIIILEYKQRKAEQAGTKLQDIDEMIKKLNYVKLGAQKNDIIYGPK